ncbi:hypothetical protein HHK36_027532 [Tetracentron sinense]|uniref:Uncharacterized protein n=1 Tax=Tetracentron sinense TaxID=13715 RepID=A0A835D154_TETSI|nr:hypothetical protein HHK36_027532 [Tetracentron sinense]
MLTLVEICSNDRQELLEAKLDFIICEDYNMGFALLLFQITLNINSENKGNKHTLKIQGGTSICQMMLVEYQRRLDDKIDRFGHFKIWHGAGSVLVAVSFSSVFGGCPPCKIFGTNSTTMQTVGYSMFAAIFNVGWAAIQVSHMSMVNCITRNSTSRVVLASCRNAFTMYFWIAYLSIFIGCCFVTIFLIGTKEQRLKQGMQGKNHQRISWANWFKKVLYYQVALVYVLTRLVTNVSQTLFAFYVINDLQITQSSKALVPAIIYICSFVVSVILQEITWTGQCLKAFYTAGGILWIFFGAGILFLPSSMHALMYLLSITIGVANALMVVCAFYQ